MSDTGGLWTEQDAGAALDYTLDWSGDFPPGDPILTATWTADPGLVLGSNSFTAATSTAFFSGGVAGRWYVVACTATTAAGRSDRKEIRVHVLPAANLAGPVSVFGDLGGAVTTLRRDRLLTVAQSYAPDALFSDEYLAEKLLAAERDVERRLRTFLTPRQMYPQGTTADELAALVAAGLPTVEEPGYDYDPGLFSGDTWGLIETRQRPIIAVQFIRFSYPSLSSRIWTVPPDWIRLDKKYGKINLVPAQTLGALPLSSYLMQALGGGRNVPFMLQVGYTAGLSNAAADYPDLLDLIKRWAVLSILDDQFLPASASTSADGLSQSLSWDAEKQRDALGQRLDALRQSMQGIRLAIM